MKQKKQSHESLPEIPAKPSRDVPRTDRERAENEGMTLKPNRDPMNHEGIKIDKAKAESPMAGLEGEGSYTAARNYREGLEHSVKKGDTDALANKAAAALDGPEGESLRAAEESGKQAKIPHAPTDAPSAATKSYPEQPTKAANEQHAKASPEQPTKAAHEQHAKASPAQPMKAAHEQHAKASPAQPTKAAHEQHAKASPAQPAKADKPIKRASPTKGHDTHSLAHR